MDQPSLRCVQHLDGQAIEVHTGAYTPQSTIEKKEKKKREKERKRDIWIQHCTPLEL
jgi:pyridoxine 5'-phosphate synthase PdxJ